MFLSEFKFNGISYDRCALDGTKPFKLIIEPYNPCNELKLRHLGSPSSTETTSPYFDAQETISPSPVPSEDTLPVGELISVGDVPVKQLIGRLNGEESVSSEDSDLDSDIFADADAEESSLDESSDDEVVKRKRPVTKQGARKTRKKAKIEKSPYPSAAEVQTAFINDLHLQLQPRVHLVRLPSYLDLNDPASELDQICTVFSNNLFKDDGARLDYIYRHVSKKMDEEKPDDDGDDFFPLNLHSRFQDNRKRAILAADTDGSESEIEIETVVKTPQRKKARTSYGNKVRKRVIIPEEPAESSSNSDEFDDDGDAIKLNTEDELELNELEEKAFLAKPEEERFIALTKRKRAFAKRNRKKKEWITISSDEPEAEGVEAEEVEVQEEEAVGNGEDANTPSSQQRKNIKRVLTEAELEKATKEATSKERKRMERLTEQEKKYKQILPEIPEDSEDPRLILDIDVKSKEVRVEVCCNLAKELKPHQFEGIKFLYSSTIENVDKLEEEGSGCILGHCMGLGKSLQIIAFIHTLMSNQFTKSRIRTILLVVPVNTLKNWTEEFDKWITKKGLRCFKVFEMVNEIDITKRVQLVENWSNEGGVLITGLTGLTRLVNLRKIPAKKNSKNEKESISPTLIRIVEKRLCDPGPDMVIIDEGHQLKAHKTFGCKAVDSIKTRRKIILTGTPLQNNLDEYHTMISLIKPRLLGSKKEFANRFRNPIENGQKADSNNLDVRLMKQRSTILNKLLSGCIQRFGYDTLKPYLEPKLEYTIFIRPSQKMAKMYNYYLDQVYNSAHNKGRLLWDATILRLCINHPALYQLQAESLSAKQDTATKQQPKSKKPPLPDDLRPIGNFSKTNGPTVANPVPNPLDQPSTSRAIICPTTGQLVEPDQVPEPENKRDWYKQFSEPDDWKNTELSGKFVMLFKILKACVAVKDKLLVVSQSLETLDLIEKNLQFHKEISIDGETVNVGWERNKNYYRIDGNMSAPDRMFQVRQFNDTRNFEARLFLLSTKAGGVGINLTGANRCIIFDVSWNPSDDIQAIFRIYRFGQTKPVYVYRFVTKDTMEEKIFRKQIVKLGMAIRVIDKHQVKRAFKAAELAEFYTTRPKEDYEISLPDVPQDRLLADLLLTNNTNALECTEFDSLLEKKPDEELTEEERQAAWAEYQKERDSEIHQAEERKKIMEAERLRNETLLAQALLAEEERLKEAERKRAEEIERTAQIEMEQEAETIEAFAASLESAPPPPQLTPVTPIPSTTSDPPEQTIPKSFANGNIPVPPTSTSSSTNSTARTTSVSAGEANGNRASDSHSSTSIATEPIAPKPLAPKPTVQNPVPQIRNPAPSGKTLALPPDLALIEQRLKSSDNNWLLDDNGSNSNNNNNKRDKSSVSSKSIRNASGIENNRRPEVRPETTTRLEPRLLSIEPNSNRSSTLPSPLNIYRNEVLRPQIIGNLNRHRTAFAYKAYARPRPNIPNLTMRTRQRINLKETSSKKSPAKRQSSIEDDTAATLHAINTSFPNRRVYDFERAATSASATPRNPAILSSASASPSSSSTSTATSALNTTRNSRPTARFVPQPLPLPRPPPSNNNPSEIRPGTSTRVHQPSHYNKTVEDLCRQNTQHPRIQDNGPYSNLNHLLNQYDPNTRNEINFPSLTNLPVVNQPVPEPQVCETNRGLGFESCDILRPFLNIDLTTCSVGEIIGGLVSSGIEHSIDKIITGIERVRGALFSRVQELNAKDATESLSDLERRKKLRLEEIVKNVDEQLEPLCK